ncbi:MAG: manganese/zinc/iron transport system ATP- binding protein [Limisphaerales bacterium]|jgi:manganese/zinc/iron transport system ATP- binding protein
MTTALSDPLLEVHDLTVTYRKKPALWDIDFGIPKGVLCGIIGPNGAGKSTLIKAIMDLVPSSSGYAKLFGKDLDEVRSRISYVPQRESVDWDFPASAFDVVLMGRYGKRGLFRRIKEEDKKIAKECLEQVGMLEYKDRQIAQLSGGQQQRVFLARALAQEADLYFMDEPFAGVDAKTEKAILELLLRLRNEGKTILVVHHDLQTAGEYFDWMIMLNTRLIACGPKEEVFTTEMLQETYSGKLTLLSAIENIVVKGELPIRES